MGTGDRAVYRFDEFTLDTASGTLRGAGGAELVLRPKGFVLLRYLLERPGVLHSRESLLDALWPGLAVTDDSLTQCVGELRRAFGERAIAVLRTLPRRGYMLVSPVRREAASTGQQPSAPAVAPGEGAPDGDLLVFDALEPASDDAEGQRLARALGAELLRAFSNSEVIRVQPLASPPLPPESYRLTGAVRRAGPEPLLSLVLGEAHSGRVLWADEVLLPPPDRREEALAVLFARLETRLVGETLQRARQRPAHALRAYDLALLAHALYRRGDEADMQQAEQYIQRAVARDPGIAIAYAYQSLIPLLRSVHRPYEQGAKDREEALGLARRAVELKPRSGLCLAALSYALAHSRQWDAALDYARSAVRLSTLSALSARGVAASALMVSGEPAEAVAALATTIALDTFGPPGPRHVLGTALMLAGRQEEGLAELRRAVILLPNSARCLRAIVIAAAELGRIDEAQQALARLRSVQPGWLSDCRDSLKYMRDPQVTERYVSALAACGEMVEAEACGAPARPQAC